MATNPVSFKMDLSDSAKALLERIGSRPGLGRVIAKSLDQENVNTVAAIKSRLKVAGKSRRGQRESASHDYPYPHRITGRLQMSIGSTSAVVETNGNNQMVIRSAVGSGIGQGSESVRYAHIHEWGGTINVPSRPTRSKAKGSDPLHPFDGAYGIKHPFTKAYTITIPERAYIRPTVKERASRYSERLSNNLIRFLRKGNN